ncbi:MAG: hypothetical protein P3W93_009565 [Thermus sp.]|nr:hypothetical protein [Thermus sp.]
MLAFAGAYSHHDQYFFRHQREMVSGAVRAPTLDLANESLLKAHIHAEWLISTELGLGDSIVYTLDIDEAHLPLRPEVAEKIRLSPHAKAELKARLGRIFAHDWEELRREGFTPEWMAKVVEGADKAFPEVFENWRSLYRFAQRELERAKKQAQKQIQARSEKGGTELLATPERQLHLLRNETYGGKGKSDFYPCRYLATEGFLPGYGFPILPVLSWVPKGNDGGKEEYIQRPRHLALTEMAPGNLIYHKGRKWQPSRFLMEAGGLEGRRMWLLG